MKLTISILLLTSISTLAGARSHFDHLPSRFNRLVKRSSQQLHTPTLSNVPLSHHQFKRHGDQSDGPQSDGDKLGGSKAIGRAGGHGSKSPSGHKFKGFKSGRASSHRAGSGRSSSSSSSHHHLAATGSKSSTKSNHSKGGAKGKGRSGGSSSGSGDHDSSSGAKVKVKAPASLSAKSSSKSKSKSTAGGKTGIATFFTQGGTEGACALGKVADSDLVVALSKETFKQNCGKTITITNTKTGKTASGICNDECPECPNNHVDLSIGFWKALGSPESLGVAPITFVIS